MNILTAAVIGALLAVSHSYESHSKSLNSKRIDDEIFSPQPGSYVVSLNYGGNMYCIGALLSPLYVITGSFCLDKRQISRRRNLYVKLAISPQTPRISYIKKIVVSSSENNLWDYGVNFAVVRLTTPISLRETVYIDMRNDFFSVNITATIKALETINDDLSHRVGRNVRVRSISIKVHPLEYCRQLLGTHLHVSLTCATLQDEADLEFTGVELGAPVVYQEKIIGIVTIYNQDDSPSTVVLTLLYLHKTYIRNRIRNDYISNECWTDE